MAQVKDLDQASLLVDLVVRQDWAMPQLSHPRPLADSASQAQRTDQQIQMVEPGFGKTGGGLSIVVGNVADNFREAVQRFLRVEEAGVHLGTSLRTGSAGTIRPVFASRMPSSMAARVFSSSSSISSNDGAGFSNSTLLDFAIADASPDLGLSRFP
jgi:hypothetical protein